MAESNEGISEPSSIESKFPGRPATPNSTLTTRALDQTAIRGARDSEEGLPRVRVGLLCRKLEGGRKL